ncbi:hypothetical protein NDU88_006212 [Pleurodeles waltl]|uniref:Uncharacterized protein n=1 Tax=Pleurodeles waltl TaxID=8319 RepID=A0AAV7SP37_PLEWA|nr:hypothetical protein NDU88_006212 [Pleurodeles waltl]
MVAGNWMDDEPGRKKCRQEKERGAPIGDTMGDRQRTKPTGTERLRRLQRPRSTERREEGHGLKYDADPPPDEWWLDIGRMTNPEGRSADKRGREEHHPETLWWTSKGPHRSTQDDSDGSGALSEISREPDELVE